MKTLEATAGSTPALTSPGGTSVPLSPATTMLANIATAMTAAMFANIVVAGLSGTLVPLGLVRAGVDPAVASSVFITTITDVVGFFVFLGLAALYLIQ